MEQRNIPNFKARPVSPLEVAQSLTEMWSPQIIGEVDDMYLKVAKVKGELVWHAHDGEDEMFMVLQGDFQLEFEEGDVTLGPGEIFVVPAGKRHLPKARNECLIMIFERKSTAHTGSEITEQTKSVAEQLQWIETP